MWAFPLYVVYAQSSTTSTQQIRVRLLDNLNHNPIQPQSASGKVPYELHRGQKIITGEASIDNQGNVEITRIRPLDKVLVFPKGIYEARQLILSNYNQNISREEVLDLGTVYLSRKSILKGRIVLSDKNAPPSSDTFAVFQIGHLKHKQKIGNNGAFAFEYSITKNMKIFVSYDGYMPLCLQPNPDTVENNIYDFGDIELLPAETLNGLVVDGKGDPVSYAIITVQFGVEGTFFKKWVKTDEEGKFAISGVPHTMSQLMANAQGYLNRKMQPVEIPEFGMPLYVILEKPFSIKAKIIDHEGNPLKDVRVSLVSKNKTWNYDSKSWASNEEGKVTLDSIGSGQSYFSLIHKYASNAYETRVECTSAVFEPEADKEYVLKLPKSYPVKASVYFADFYKSEKDFSVELSTYGSKSPKKEGQLSIGYLHFSKKFPVANGTLPLPDLPTGEYELCVQISSYPRRLRFNVSEQGDNYLGEILVNIKSTVTGTLVDSKTGKPFELDPVNKELNSVGIRYRRLPGNNWKSEWFDALPDGKFEISGLDPRKEYEFVIESSRFIRNEFKVIPKGRRVDVGQIELSSGRSVDAQLFLDGKVLESGKNIELVDAENDKLWVRGHTSENGRIHLTRIPDNCKTIRLKGESGEYSPPIQLNTELQGRHQNLGRIDMIQRVFFAIQVYDRNGKRINDADVYIERIDTEKPVEVFKDPAYGYRTKPLLRGKYFIYVHKDGVGTWRNDNYSLHGNAYVRFVRAELSDAWNLSGRIIDNSLDPYTSLKVSLVKDEMQPNASSTTTDKDGYFLLNNLQPAPCYLMIEHHWRKGRLYRKFIYKTRQIMPGEIPEIQLPSHGLFRGQVVYRGTDVRPSGPMQIQIEYRKIDRQEVTPDCAFINGSLCEEVVMDEDGRFTLARLHRGNAGFTLSGMMVPLFSRFSGKIQMDNPNHWEDFPMPPVCSVKGKIVPPPNPDDFKDGIPGIGLHIKIKGGGNITTSIGSLGGYYRPDGTFGFGAVPPGSGTITLSLRDGVAVAEVKDLQPGKINDIGIVSIKRPRSIKARLIDNSNGLPVTDLKITPTLSYSMGHIQTAEAREPLTKDGMVIFTEIPYGVEKAYIVTGQYQPVQVTSLFESIRISDEKYLGEIRLEPTIKKKLRLLTLQGEPIRNAKCTISVGGWQDIKFKTDNDGRATVDGLSPGRQILQFEAKRNEGNPWLPPEKDGKLYNRQTEINLVDFQEIHLLTEKK